MQYGSSWYHSHYSVQYADGAVGPLVSLLGFPNPSQFPLAFYKTISLLPVDQWVYSVQLLTKILTDTARPKLGQLRCANRSSDSDDRLG